MMRMTVRVNPDSIPESVCRSCSRSTDVQFTGIGYVNGRGRIVEARDDADLVD